MIQIEKDEILQQVGSVLQLCHQIVSRLPRLDCSTLLPAQVGSWREDDINDSLWRKEDSINDDDEEKEVYQDDLWWDDVYPPLHFYTLVYDDNDLSLYDVDTSNYSLQQSAMMEDEVMQSPMTENEVIQSTMVEDGLMQSPRTEDVLMHSAQRITGSASFTNLWAGLSKCWDLFEH